MTIIVPGSNKSQKEYLRDICQFCDTLLIASPFIAEDVSGLLEEIISGSKVRKITLITCINSFGQQGSQPQKILDFIEYCSQNNIQHEIRVDDEKFHGKVYMALQNKVPQSCIITSANFTFGGLSFNHECGVVLSEKSMLEQQKTLHFSLIMNSHQVFDEAIRIANSKAALWSASNPTVASPSEPFQTVLLPVVPEKSTCFLKPNGWSKERINLHCDDLSWFAEQRWFSAKNNRLGIGDISIDYAVSTEPDNSHPILGVFSLISNKFQNPLSADTRWPHYKDSENLLPDYTSLVVNPDIFKRNWITLEMCAAKYKKEFPSMPMSIHGCYLPDLETQSDHFFIENHFARFIAMMVQCFVAENTDK